MPKFEFRLQPLLEKKKNETKEALNLLTERGREVAEAEAELRSLQQREAEMAEEIRGKRHALANAPVTSGEELRARRDHIRAISQDLELAKDNTMAQGLVVEQARERENEARANLAECRRQEEILEKYRDKQAERFHRQQEQKEALELDEVGNTLYLNRRFNG